MQFGPQYLVLNRLRSRLVYAVAVFLGANRLMLQQTDAIVDPLVGLLPKNVERLKVTVGCKFGRIGLALLADEGVLNARLDVDLD